MFHSIQMSYHIDEEENGHNKVTLDASTVPSRKGYTFLGWAFDENYKLPATDDSQSGDDIAPSTDDTQWQMSQD